MLNKVKITFFNSIFLLISVFLKQNICKKLVNNFLYIIFFLSFLAPANSQIIIKGNQRIDEQTILSLINKTKNSEIQYFTPENIDKTLKTLYQSDLFLEVEIFQEDDDIIISVQENPIISEVKIIGNDKIEDDVLINELLLKKRGIYTKFKLQSDLKRINEIYLKSGRFLAKIEPKIIQKPQNRIEVIFDIKEGPRAKISEILFIGNNAFSDSDLIEQITTKPTKWYKFMSSSDIYDSDRIEFDREKLRRFYGTKGYADFTTISATAQISPTKDRFFITFLLEEGIKYNIGDIEINNQIEKFDESLLQEAIMIKSGKIYNYDLIEKTVDKMLEIMSENSYAFADIDPIIKRDRENKIIDIEFLIRQSPRIYIDKIEIRGNTRTQDEVIRRELRVTDGDPYNLTKINRSKQRIENLGFFEIVDFKTKRVGQSDKVILEINVKEKKTGELNFGVGYSTVNRATANIGLKERNFLGTGRQLGVNLQRSQFNLSGNIDYSKPHFMNRPLTVGINLFAFQSDSRDTLVYNQDSKGFSLRAVYSITEYLIHQLSYSFRDESISDINENASLIIQSLEGSFLSSSISSNLSYDKRDNRIDPKKGYYISFGQEYTGIGGDIKTLKHTGSAGFYQPLYKEEVILKLLARGGHVDGLGQDVRNNLGFFLGGNNFRGFEFAGLGPRTVNDNGSAVGGNAVGGNLYYVASAELRFPLGLPKELGIYGILFSENGTVKSVDSATSQFAEIADTGTLRSSYGLSIAWTSPLGPIRFDFSRIAKSEEFDRTQTFQFNFGTSF